MVQCPKCKKWYTEKALKFHTCKKEVEKVKEVPEKFDFTVIDGIGKKTAEKIITAGITTFEQLKFEVEIEDFPEVVGVSEMQWKNIKEGIAKYEVK